MNLGKLKLCSLILKIFVMLTKKSPISLNDKILSLEEVMLNVLFNIEVLQTFLPYFNILQSI